MNPYIISCPNMYDMLKAKVDFCPGNWISKEKNCGKLVDNRSTFGAPLNFLGYNGSNELNLGGIEI